MARCNGQLRKLRKELGLSQRELADRAIVGLRTLTNAERGLELTPDTVNAIANALEVHPDEIIQQESVDALAEGPYKFHRYVQNFLLPSENAFCKDEADARKAVVQMRENWVLHISRDQNSAVSQPFCDGNNMLLDSSFEDYRARYVSLWKRHRSSVMFATRSGKRNGISVILPVVDAAYDRLRRGEINFLDITPDDVCERSQNLIIDSCVEFGSNRTGLWYSLTDSLRFVVFFQIASLSFDTLADDFRILSFGASPLNADRLAANGFQELPVLMPHFGFPIYEFAQPSPDDVALEQTTFAHYASRLQKKFTRGLGLKIKQAIMRRSLRAYQVLLARYPNIDHGSAVA